jgi:hypothetical protein
MQDEPTKYTQKDFRNMTWVAFLGGVVVGGALIALVFVTGAV